MSYLLRDILLQLIKTKTTSQWSGFVDALCGHRKHFCVIVVL